MTIGLSNQATSEQVDALKFRKDEDPPITERTDQQGDGVLTRRDSANILETHRDNRETIDHQLLSDRSAQGETMKS